MINIYSIIFFIITLFIYIFNNYLIITECNITNKFLIFLLLIIINICINTYSYFKEGKTIDKINMMKLAIYYSFIGTFAYTIFYDLLQIKNIGMSTNVTIQILLCSIFITGISFIFYKNILF